MRVGIAPGGRDALRAAAGELDGDHGLDAADEDFVGPGGGGDFEADEETDFFQARELGGDGEAVAEAGGLELIDFGAGDDGDKPGAAHFFEAPAKGGGKL